MTVQKLGTFDSLLDRQIKTIVDAINAGAIDPSLFATAAQGIKADSALPATSQAVDSAKLAGSLPSAFATSTQGTKADNALPATSKAVDSDKLDGKHWVEILNGSTTIIANGQAYIYLPLSSAHNFYRFSVYSSLNEAVWQGYGTPSPYANLAQGTATTQGYLYIKGSPSGQATFYYKVDVWQ